MQQFQFDTVATLEKSKTAAIIVGAGLSTRMGRNKVFMELLRRPALTWTVDAFEGYAPVDKIVLVLNRDDIKQGEELVMKEGWRKVMRVCPGGERRQDSVKNGLDCLIGNYGTIMIHDAARPCITHDILGRGLAAVKETGAAIAAVGINDTIKRTRLEYNIEVVKETVQRDNLRLIQTPQVFDYALIARAHEGTNYDVTDDAMMVENVGGRVVVYEGARYNIKLTTQSDIGEAERFLASHSRYVSHPGL